MSKVRDYEKNLPKPKPAANTGIMVRPDAEVLAWVNELAADAKCSVNKLVLAILRTEMELYRERQNARNTRLAERLGPSVADQLAASKAEHR